jgi:hypothetical protein
MVPAPDEPGLQALLVAEQECCARLLPILDAERAAAATYDHAALLACLKEREAVQAEWHRVAERRRARLRGAGTTLAGVAAADPTLADTVAETRRLATIVRRAQRVNEGVIRGALAQVTDLLAALQREHPASRYDQHATMTNAPVTTRGGWSA